MEESNEVPSDENKISLKTNKKKILKTPTQINGLEKFYNEHKYPTEEQKKQLAQQLELTEKQVSVWFCHRRLKDKRLFAKEENTNGHKQDSCGSTKRGSYWHADPREVDSRSLHGQDFPDVDPSPDRKCPRRPDPTNMDGTSSESSSPLQDRMDSKRTDLHNAGAKQREYKPSGYLKVRSEVEHTALTAVKMRLGRHYCEDGPPLGVHFESIPPGAFWKTDINSAREPYLVEDSGLPHSSDMSGARAEPIQGTNHGLYAAQMNFRDQCVEVENPHAFQNAYSQHSRSQHCSKLMSLKPENPLMGRILPLDAYKHAAGEVSAYSRRDNDKIETRIDVEGFTSDCYPDCHLGPYSGKSTDEHTEHLFYRSYKTSPKVVPTDVLNSKHSRVKLRCTEPFETSARGPPKMMHRRQKEEKPYDKKKLKVAHGQDMVTKRIGSKFYQQEHIIKGSAAERASLTNQFKGSSKEMPSSFSEDETADTSSSLN